MNPLKRNITNLWLSLLFIELVFVGLFCVDVVFDQPHWLLHELFDLDGERTIPAWFSSVQLFLIAAVLAATAFDGRADAVPSRHSLFLGAAIFVFLSADEATLLHEKANDILAHIEWLPRFQGDHGLWVLVYLLGAAALAWALRRSIAAMWREHGNEARLAAAGGAIMVAGAIGLEIVGYVFTPERGGIPYLAEVATEEFLEMLGASTVLCGVILLAIRRHSCRR